MYIQITTKCNMSCKHCCYAANLNGKDMSFDSFQEILRKWYSVIDDKDGFVVLGGGEPTSHPQFWEMVDFAYPYGQVWVATNGSNKGIALALCELAKKGALHAVLSIDKWHDPIDPEVVKVYTQGLDTEYHGYYKCMINKKNPSDHREIRTVIIPINGGRARKLFHTRKDCPCPGIHFKPNDNIYPCGCDDAPIIGTIKDGIQDIQYKYYDLNGGCHKKTNIIYKKE